MNNLPWRTQIYLGLVLGSALLLSGWLLLDSGLPAASQLPLAGLLAVCMALAWLFPLPVGFKTHFYLDTSVVIAAVLLFDAGPAIVIVGIGTLAAQCLRRRFWDEALFNTGQAMIQAAVAGLLITAAGYQPGVPEVGSPGFVVAVVTAGVALFVLSAVLVGTIVSLQGGFSPLGVWAESVLNADDAVYLGHVAQIGLGIVIVVLGNTQPWTIVLLIPLVAVVYVALKHGFELRRHAEIALRFSEKSLNEAQRLAHIGSWEWDLTTGAQGWSAETYRIFGLEPLALTPNYEYILERMHPDDRERVDQAIHEAIRARSGFDLEHRVVAADGEEIVVHHRGEIITDGSDARTRLVATIHDISERKSMESRLAFMAFHDPLTGLPNGNFLAGHLEEAAEAWRGGGRRFALLFVDLDYFKRVNDSLGHEQGDRLLVEIGRQLKAGLRQDDVVARYGGDEFVILARSVDDPETAERLAARLVSDLAASIPSDPLEVPVTASIGLVVPDSRLDTPRDLFHRADVALYHAKREGRNRYARYHPAMEQSASRSFQARRAPESEPRVPRPGERAARARDERGRVAPQRAALPRVQTPRFMTGAFRRLPSSQPAAGSSRIWAAPDPAVDADAFGACTRDASPVLAVSLDAGAGPGRLADNSRSIVLLADAPKPLLVTLRPQTALPAFEWYAVSASRPGLLIWSCGNPLRLRHAERFGSASCI